MPVTLNEVASLAIFFVNII